MGSNKSDKILFIIISVFIVILLISIGPNRVLNGTFSLTREAYYWMERGLSAPMNFVANIWSDYIYLVNTRQENENLRHELAKLKIQCRHTREIQDENSRLRAMLEFKKTSYAFKLYPASVFAQDISMIFKTLVINRGRSDGFFKDMPIVNMYGVVGRVISVSPHTSEVLLITDPNSAVPAFIKTIKTNGIVRGRGDGLLNLEYIRRSENVNAGDEVVTSGLLGIFPRGLRLGYVYTVKKDRREIFAQIILKPAVSMQRIEDVFGIGKTNNKHN